MPGNSGDPFTSYTEAGFLVQNSAGQYAVSQGYGNPIPDLFSGYDYTYIGLTATALITITAVGGGAFTFLSADLAATLSSSTYTFSGSFNGVPVFMQTGTVNGGFSTFNSTSPSVQLTSLKITGNGPDYNVDNIVVNPSATAVTPEPSSIALLGTGMLGVAGMLRKRFA